MKFTKIIDGLNLNWGKKQNTYIPLTQCLNCSAQLDDHQLYCYTCGQKNKTSKVTIWSLLGDLLSNIFNLDHSVWKSLLGVFKPAYLTKEFIKGKRKSYLNPLRLFFVTMIVHLAILSSWLNTDWANDMANHNIESIVLKELKDNLREIKESNNYFATSKLDSIESLLFKDKNIKDTIRTNMVIAGQYDLNKFPLATQDIYELSRDEILEKYGIDDFWDQLIYGQYIRMLQDLSGALNFAFGNILWAIVATIFLLSFVTKLLYIRKKKYFVEHILLQFNIHSFTFIILSIPLLALKLNKHSDISESISYFVLATLIYGFWSYKSYYGQGWIKTILKTLFLGMTYAFLMALCIIFVLFISALIF